MSPGSVVVTGTASGIGAAIARNLRDHGWRVGGLDLRPSPDVDSGRIVDMTDTAAVASAVASLRENIGPIEAAVSAAGYYEMIPITDVTPVQWQRMLRVHLGGMVNLSRAVLPAMVEAGSGSLVAITSELAVGGGGEGDAHYSAAKGALIGFVRSLAVELAATGVRVNAVAPGPTDTPLLAADSPWRAPAYLSTLPAGRLVTPDEVALCVGFLVEDGTYLAGEVLNPNAGAVI